MNKRKNFRRLRFNQTRGVWISDEKLFSRNLDWNFMPINFRHLMKIRYTRELLTSLKCFSLLVLLSLQIVGRSNFTYICQPFFVYILSNAFIIQEEKQKEFMFYSRDLYKRFLQFVRLVELWWKEVFMMSVCPSIHLRVYMCVCVLLVTTDLRTLLTDEKMHLQPLLETLAESLIPFSIITQLIIENPAWWLARKLGHKSRYSPTGDYNSEGTEARWRLPL